MANLFIDKRNSNHGVDEWGHEGNDTLLGSDFDDKLKGAQGNDTIRGNGGDDQIMDLTWIGFEPDFDGLFNLNRELASSRLTISNFASGNIEIGAQVLGQALFHGGSDKFYGGDGDDYLLGLEGNDRLEGGAGLDVLLGGSGNDTMIGGDGDDIFGGDRGNDYMLGGAGADLMNGGAGDDRLEGGANGDILIGGEGEDTAIYDQSIGGVHVNLRFGAVALDNPRFSEAPGDRLESIENVEGSRADDIITGSDVANELFGGLGNDLLIGGKGADELIGDGGIDATSYISSAAGVIVRLDDTNLHIASSASGGDAQGDELSSIENLTGSRFGDSLTGNSFANVISGVDGNDTISGLGGADRLFGGAGADTLLGGDNDDFLSGAAGGDLIDGGAGIDTVSFAENARAVTVTLGNGSNAGQASTFVPAGLFGVIEFDTLLNVENITGSAAGDRLTGNSDRNTIHGGLGDDTLRFSLGGDILDGDGGIDTLDLSGGPAVTVNLTATLQVAGVNVATTLRDMENVIGSTFRDDIGGTAGDNVITGGEGGDILRGNGGSDTFVFRSMADMGDIAANLRDVITDFSDGDLLDFRTLDADFATAGIQDFTFIGEAAFSGAGGEMRAKVGGGGNMNISFDIDGDSQADGLIRLTGVRTFDTADFLI